MCVCAFLTLSLFVFLSFSLTVSLLLCFSLSNFFFFCLYAFLFFSFSVFYSLFFSFLLFSFILSLSPSLSLPSFSLFLHLCLYIEVCVCFEMPRLLTINYSSILQIFWGFNLLMHQKPILKLLMHLILKQKSTSKYNPIYQCFKKSLKLILSSPRPPLLPKSFQKVFLTFWKPFQLLTVFMCFNFHVII